MSCVTGVGGVGFKNNGSQDFPRILDRTRALVLDDGNKTAQENSESGGKIAEDIRTSRSSWL